MKQYVWYFAKSRRNKRKIKGYWLLAQKKAEECKGGVGSKMCLCVLAEYLRITQVPEGPLRALELLTHMGVVGQCEFLAMLFPDVSQREIDCSE